MAKRIFTSAGLTFTAAAAGTANITSSTYMALKAGSATQYADVLEILVSGKAPASVVAAFVFKRVSTLETTLTALAAPHSDGLAFPFGTALSTTFSPFVAAATGPTPSNTVTDATLQLGMNGFGGILRWNAQTFQQWAILGSGAPGQESILFNSSTASGANSAGDAHIIYEPA